MSCIDIQTLRLDKPVYAQNATGDRRPTALETTHATVPSVGIDGETRSSNSSARLRELYAQQVSPNFDLVLLYKPR